MGTLRYNSTADASGINSGSMFALEMDGGSWEPATWVEYEGVRMKKMVGAVRIKCPRAPYSSFDYPWTLACLMTRCNTLACPPLAYFASRDPLEPALSAMALSLTGRNSCLA